MRFTVLLVVVVTQLALSEATSEPYFPDYVRRADLVRRRTDIRLLQAHVNPVTGMAFFDPAPSRITRPLFNNGIFIYNPAIVLRLVGSQSKVPRVLQRLEQLQKILTSDVMQPIFDYYTQVRLSSTLNPRLVAGPRLQPSSADVQRGILQFVMQIDPQLLTQVRPSIYAQIRSQLLGIDQSFRVPLPLLRQSYSTFISVMAGNGLSSYLTRLPVRTRYRNFAVTLGRYLRDNQNVLPDRLMYPSQFLQGFATAVDSRFILTNGGLVVRGHRVRDAADDFFQQLEAEHVKIVGQVLSAISRVQRSIELSALPMLGFQSGLLANQFYHGFDPLETDNIARYLVSGIPGIRGMRTPGLISALGIMPYAGRSPQNLVPGILGTNLGGYLQGLNVPGLKPKVTTTIVRAVLQSKTVTQVLLAALNQGIVPSTIAQGVDVFGLTIARMLLENRNPDFLRLLKSPLGVFPRAVRVTLPNLLPLLIRRNVPVKPISRLISLQAAIHLGKFKHVPVRILRLVGTAAPVPEPTPPPFPGIVLSGITIPGTYAQKIYDILVRLLPGLPVPLLQPTLQLFVPSTTIPVTVLKTPEELIKIVRTKLVPLLQPIITSAIGVASVPSFIKDSIFTLPNAQLAYGLECLVLASRDYTVLPKPLISSVLSTTLQAYYTTQSAFTPASFLDYSLKYYPQLVGAGLLATPLTFGSTTLDPLQVTSLLSGLRPVYGDFSYRALGTILASGEAGKILSGVDLTNIDALTKALTFGQSKPLITTTPSVIKSIENILKPLLSKLFNPLYTVQDLQGLLCFSLNYLRVPDPLVTPLFPELFQKSVQRLLELKGPLIGDISYSPLILDNYVSLVVDQIVSGRLTPDIKVTIPSGSLTLTSGQIYKLNTQLQEIGLTIMPTFAGQIISSYFSISPQLQQVEPAEALTSFIRYIRERTYVRDFSFRLKPSEYLQVRQALVKAKRLPTFFTGYPIRLQNYFFDSMYGAYALSTRSHFSSQHQIESKLSHSVLLKSFIENIAPYFFKQPLANIEDLYQAAPNYFQLCERNYAQLQSQYGTSTKIVFHHDTGLSSSLSHYQNSLFHT